MPRVMEGSVQANFQLPRDLHQKAKNLRINVAAVCRMAIEDAVAPRDEAPLDVRLERLAREVAVLAAEVKCGE